MASFKTTVQMYDFAVDGAASSVDFAIPKGHTIVDYMVKGLVTAGTNDLLRMRTLVGGVADAATNDYAMSHNYRAISYNRVADYMMCSHYSELCTPSELVECSGRIYGTRTANCPMHFANVSGHPTVASGRGTSGGGNRYAGGDAVDGLRFYNSNGANYTTGKIYVVSFKRAVTIQTVDLSDFVGSLIADLPAVPARTGITLLHGTMGQTSNGGVMLQGYDVDTAAWVIAGYQYCHAYSAGDNAGSGAGFFTDGNNGGNNGTHNGLLLNLSGSSDMLATMLSGRRCEDGVQTGNGTKNHFGAILPTPGLKSAWRLRSTAAPTFVSGTITLTHFRM